MTHYTIELKKFNENNEECDSYEVTFNSEAIAIIILIAVIIILIATILALIL
jgi:hypothetical protein